MSSIRISRTLVILAALFPLAGCPTEDTTLTHGLVKLEMRRSDNQASNPYIGTASVIVTMQYRECLQGYYESNPDLQQEGREGEKIFGGTDLGGEGWGDSLCETGDVPGQADCAVISIDQQLDQVKQLTVNYAITGELEGRVLPFGPLPTKETAGCFDAIVRAAPSGAKGYNGEGAEVWIATAFSPTEAVTNQGGEITIEAAVSDN